MREDAGSGLVWRFGEEVEIEEVADHVDEGKKSADISCQFVELNGLIEWNVLFLGSVSIGWSTETKWMKLYS